MYTTIEKLEDKHIEQLINLYKQCWWSKDRNIEDVKVMLDHSQVIGILNSSDDLIGFSRILTDGMYKAFVFDVIVDIEYRGKGIGEMLLNNIISHPTITNVKHIELYCKDEMIPFYERWGFKNAISNFNFMRRSI